MYATRGTIEGILASTYLGAIPEGLFTEITADEPFAISDLIIHPVAVSHDANEPVAYRIEQGDRSAGIVTDLGIFSDYTVESFAGVDALLLEANQLSGQLLCKLLHDNLKTVVLGHLSAENNLAELAYETVRLEILMDDNVYKPDDFQIRIASRHERSQLIAV